MKLGISDNLLAVCTIDYRTKKGDPHREPPYLYDYSLITLHLAPMPKSWLAGRIRLMVPSIGLDLGKRMKSR